jgi:antitoxin HicB
MSHLRYPVVLSPAAEGGFVVSFPDVPEAITQGDDRAEALTNARDALETALEIYVDGNQELPAPRAPKRGQTLVSPAPLAALKFELYQTMREQGVRKSELARKLGWHMPQVDRLLDIRHASRLDQIERAARVLGKHVSVEISDAA